MDKEVIYRRLYKLINIFFFTLAIYLQFKGRSYWGTKMGLYIQLCSLVILLIQLYIYNERHK